jgi:hypothetical protein
MKRGRTWSYLIRVPDSATWVSKPMALAASLGASWCRGSAAVGATWPGCAVELVGSGGRTPAATATWLRPGSGRAREPKLGDRATLKRSYAPLEGLELSECFRALCALWCSYPVT